MPGEKWLSPLFDLKKIGQGIRAYPLYFRDWMAYSSLRGGETLSPRDAYPCLHDRTATTPIDAHYFYQDIWAFSQISQSRTQTHVDIGSRAIFVGMLSAITKVTFVDIRPLEVNLDNYYQKRGDLLNLPFSSNSIVSLSCLHVAEHVGLGRYGDRLDSRGTEKAISELSRVLMPNGSLYFSVPLGSPRVCFNAHRVLAPEQILDFFSDLRLMRFSGVDDFGRFRRDANPTEFSDAKYACGLFHFAKP